MNLVIRFSALGDLVLCSSFAEALSGPTLFITQNAFKPFVQEYFPGSELKVYGVEKPKYGLLGWFAAGIKMATFLKLYGAPRIKNLNIYDLHNVSKSWIFVFGILWELKRSRIVEELKVYRTKKERLRRWILLLFKKDIAYKEQNIFERHFELINPDSTQTPTPKLCIHKPQPFPEAGSSHIRILLAPDAQHWKKIWPQNYWLELVQTLSQRESIRLHLTVVGQNIIINPDNIQKIQEQSKNGFVVQDFQGKTSLLQLPILAAEHDITITGNSAWQHISEASGTPVISLAGPIVSAFGFSPFLEKSREIFREMACRPCTLHGDGICFRSKKNHHACMNEISPQLVLKTLWNTLGYRSAPQ